MSALHPDSWSEESNSASRFKDQSSHCYDDLSALRTDLVRTISATVSSHRLTPDACQEMSDVVKTYSASLQQLKTIHGQAEAFVETLCGRHYVTDDDRLDALRIAKTPAVIATEAGKDFTFLTLDPIRVSVNLEPELFALSPAEGAIQLQRDLTESVRKFVDDFLAVLDKLVELRVVGTIEWPIPTGCRFRFFQTHLEVSAENARNEIFLQDGQWFRREHRRTYTAHTLHGQQQHLADARRTELPTYTRSMPQRVRELCDDIPTWLEERVDVVDGDLFRSDRVEEHLRTEVLEDTELVYHNDPAIVVGPFVLATWLCEEVDAERHRAQNQRHLRQQEVEQQQNYQIKESYKPLVWGACLQAIPLTLQLAAISLWPSFHWALIALSLVLFAVIAPQLRGVALAYGARPDMWFCLIAAGAGVCGVLGLQVLVLAFGYVALPLLLLGLFLAFISVVLLRELKAVLQPTN